MRKLFYGENAEIKKKLAYKSIDLIYMDPPSNSKNDYNVLFKGKAVGNQFHKYKHSAISVLGTVIANRD